MKIAHVCPFYEPAICGVKQVVKELAKRQRAEGHGVHVFTSDWDKKKRIKQKEEIIDGIHVHRCFHIAKIGNFSSIFPSVFFRLLSNTFDLIHTHNSGHAHVFLASLAAKMKNTTLIHTTHCPWTDAHRSFIARCMMFFSYNIFNKMALKWSKKIIAITPWEIQFIEKYAPSDKITVIPNGVDEEFFTTIKENKFKEKHEVKDALVLFFGRLNITKGPDKFVLAAKETIKENNQITFVLAGPDEGMLDYITKLAEGDKNIKIIGALKTRKDVIEMYQAADVFVLPSFREGLPLTLFEAMASGLPIVASPVNGVPYEMNDPENGYFVQYGDIKNLKRAILRILDNPNIRNEMSKNNKAKAKQYAWNVIYKKTKEVYEK